MVMGNVDVRVGSEFAGYRIESLIGRGGMSVVYLAEHLRLGRKVAIKVLAPELAQEEGFRNRFIRESRLAASIDHPNIVPIYDASEVEGLLYIAMRYVEGTDLKSILREEGRLPLDQVAPLIGQVASALDAAHERGLVHRDVKPGNVLLAHGVGVERTDHVYLADFGLTKQALSVSGMTATGQLVGTIDYVAPEQIRGEPLDGRADVYSLGCMLFECLDGHPPFKRDAEVSTLYAHLQEPPPSITDRRSDLSPGLDGIVAKAMAKSPDDRYATAGDLIPDVRKELRDDARPPASVVRAPRRRRRAIGLAAASAVALVVAALALVVTLGGHAEEPSAKGSGRPGGVAAPPLNSVVHIDTNGRMLRTVGSMPTP
jgi:serine/threonine protein kinase